MLYEIFMDAPIAFVITHCAQVRRPYVTNSPMQHALREMRRIFSAPLTQIILIAVVILLGLSGPFGTLENITFGPRMAYWGVIVLSTFAIGILTSAFIAQALRAQKSPWPTRICAAFATAFTVSLTVALINWLAFGGTFHITQMAPVFAIAGVIDFVFQLISEQQKQGKATAPAPPPLLQRIELDKRGALISMSVQDHYVEVTTSKGTSLLLMRLSDAMRETGDTVGVHIHRSHWAATDHITKAQRDSDKAILTLSDGRSLPASRSRIKDLKNAGILPR